MKTYSLRVESKNRYICCEVLLVVSDRSDVGNPAW